VAERTRQLELAGTKLRERNEALRAANHELEELDALKDEFVALVSHELRAPLTNVRASAELLLAKEEDPAKRDKLEIVGQEAERLARLVRGVLDAGRMRAGRFTVKPGPFDAADLVRASLARLGDEDAARVRAKLPAEAPWVLADAERVGEVLDNLLDNALKYSPDGSKIEVTIQSKPRGESNAASEMAQPASTKTDDVQFAITDHGIGIPPEERERIFDRFHRVERGDARETYGHGLGLYIARQIIEAHGGTLAVDSRQGEGSTFVFRLPAAPEE
jgi:signal transduction histidine kinase